MGDREVFSLGRPTRSASRDGALVLCKGAITQANLADLGNYGTVLDTVPEIKLVTMRSTASQLPAIRARSYVAAANPDAERKGSPVDTVAATNFAND